MLKVSIASINEGKDTSDRGLSHPFKGTERLGMISQASKMRW
jgi:hypothetical protein